MKRNYLSTLFVGMLLCTSTVMAQEHQIHLKSGTVSTEQMTTVRTFDSKAFKHGKINGRIYAMLQFKTIPTEVEKERIAGAGIQLLNYVPDHAFIAHFSSKINATILQELGVEHIVEIKPKYKLSKELAMGNFPTYALNSKDRINVVAYTYSSVALDQLSSALNRNGFELFDATASKNGLAVSVEIADLETLAALPEVMFIEPIEAPAIPEGIKGRTNNRANTLSNAPGTGYDGTGVTVAIADDGGINHIDFQGRLTDFNASPGGTHGDMTAGLTSGCGNLDPTKIGFATGTYLNMYGISGYPHVINAISNYNTLGTIITSTSYSQGCGGVYDGTARDIDTDVHDEPQLLHMFSAGNSSSSNCSSVYGSLVAPDGRYYGNITGGRKAAKNTVAVANLLYTDARVSSSSRGPCEDGRLKPDISSTGASQQSTGPDNTYLGAGGTSQLHQVLPV